MQEVSVIIPNFNGMAYLDGVLAGLECQTVSNFDVILVDNGSNDGSCAFVAARYPWVHLIELPENFGFCKAVNEGIRASRSPYVLLLNNDIEVTENFIEEMLSAIKRHPKAFSCAARMIQFHDRDRLDDAGNYYCALGWAYARGKGKDIHTYEKEEKIFASCAGAAIYRKKIFDELGYFDEEHFAYLEDMDVGYRARIYGYENWYALAWQDVLFTSNLNVYISTRLIRVQRHEKAWWNFISQRYIFDISQSAISNHLHR